VRKARIRPLTDLNYPKRVTTLMMISCPHMKCRLVAIIAALLSGCSPVVRTNRIAATSAAAGARANFVSTARLSETTRQELRMAGLEGDHCLDGCHTRVPFFEDKPREVTLYARSELALSHASRLARAKQPSVGAHLQAARLALEGITSPACMSSVSFICDDFKLFYLSAVINVLAALQEVTWDGGKLMESSDFKVVVSPGSVDEDPRRYATITPAGLVSFEGLSNRLLRFGLGVPLSACRPRDPKNPTDTYLPRVGTCLPLTAVVDFPEPGNTAVISLHNSFTTETVTVANGKTFPLAANFSAPFASLIEKTGLTSYSGLLRALSGGKELLEKTGFFTVEPYRTGRVPLIFVHGLFSSPVTWVNLQNDLMGDPIIREHYQVWSYLYPTNLPILLNAETFREKLDQLKRHLSESDNTTAENLGMVIIAHSMGGLLTKTAVVRDSEPVKQYLWESPEKINELDPDTRALVDRVFTFRLRPYVERVIFIAVPFLGSEIADNWVGWLGRRLIGLPSKILQATGDFPARIRNIIRPELRADLAEQDLTSVKGLSPHNPALLALAKALVDRCVPYHLIEGDRGLGGGANSSDGVVPFRSSHLEGAESELIVPADHAAFTHPIAVLEIKRILHEHIRQKALGRRQCER
jgi:pimeloyl-ACP methyl ester carboxylesterase